MHFLRQLGKRIGMSRCMRKVKNAQTYTYQLQHVLILWHDGELQYTLTAKRSERDPESMSFNKNIYSMKTINSFH